MCMACGLVVFTLLPLAAGYVVLLKADKADGNLKQIGKVIGWVIVVISALTMLWSIGMSLKCVKKGYCVQGKYGMHKSWCRHGKGKAMEGKTMDDKKCCHGSKHMHKSAE